MSITAVKEYPISIVYLDGEKIVEYYGMGDVRNFGECFLEAETTVSDNFYMTIPREGPCKTIMSYKGKQFPVKLSKTMCNDYNTGLYTIERIVE